VSDEPAPKLRQVQRRVEDRIRELAEAGELRGDGRPLPDDREGTDDTWAARHVARNANAVPEWVQLRRDIDERVARLRRRVDAHREWLRDRTRYLAELPADRIVETAHATTARDQRVRAEVAEGLSEVNALVRRYDLLVVPTLQLPLVTLERLGLS
jgi:Asp-tRNA(Asn)/Glu-tRNA(Gln) amidotransferase A subunit family amidase